MSSNYPSIYQSNLLFERARKIMFPVTQTLAKGPTQYVDGVAPKYLKRGKGSHVWDVDGNEFIDYNMAIGPVSLGYSYDKVDDAIIKQLRDGITFSLMHELEVVLCELINGIIPNAEGVRIAKTGAEVTSAAVRISRAFTGRKKILCCGYHGWHDWYIGTTSRNSGVPREIKALTSTFEYNNIESLQCQLDDEVACVILEPFIFEAPSNHFLQQVKDLCVKNGSLLIFDEMWTGFRVALGGAQEYFEVLPDLATYSKACANGMPIALLTGRKDVLQLFENDVFFFSTFGGEVLSIAAAIATIHEMIDKRVPQSLSQKGKLLKDGYNALAVKHNLQGTTACHGLDCRTIITFSASTEDPLILKSFVQQEMIKRGILWGGFHNVSYSHADADIKYTLEMYDDVLSLLSESLKNGNVSSQLRGKPVEAVFRKTGNLQNTMVEKLNQKK